MILITLSLVTWWVADSGSISIALPLIVYVMDLNDEQVIAESTIAKWIANCLVFLLLAAVCVVARSCKMLKIL